MAGSDPLTGLPNRRAFFEQARALLGMCRRNALPVAVLVIDIDHFKRINDTRGHAMGDFALRHLAHLMQSGVRVSDLCCRLGGEEFAVLLPNTSPQAAHGLAEKLRERIAAHPVELPGEALRITASLGAAHGEGELEVLLAAADAAMYAAKEAGRNRVESRACGAG